jgi:transposase InsO family protein
MKSSFRKPDVVAAHFSCSSYVKMNRIAIDYIESLRADGKGNDMIIVIIDCFSRWVSLTAVQSKSGGTFADAYIAWLGLCFGEPKEILTDRGAQFTSNLTEQLTAVTGGRMIFTTAGSKQENAIVERANREVMRHLRNVIMDRRAMDEWSRYLPFVQRIMNTMVH